LWSSLGLVAEDFTFEDFLDKIETSSVLLDLEIVERKLGCRRLSALKERLGFNLDGSDFTSPLFSASPRDWSLSAERSGALIFLTPDDVTERSSLFNVPFLLGVASDDLRLLCLFSPVGVILVEGESMELILLESRGERIGSTVSVERLSFTDATRRGE
jgi:hypothetical protein